MLGILYSNGVGENREGFSLPGLPKPLLAPPQKPPDMLGPPDVNGIRGS